MFEWFGETLESIGVEEELIMPTIMLWFLASIAMWFLLGYWDSQSEASIMSFGIFKKLLYIIVLLPITYVIVLWQSRK